MSRPRTIAAALFVSLAVACGSTDPMLPRVQFRITDTVGPCSSSAIGIRFTADGVVLAVEDFIINSRPSGELSSEFAVAAGTHTLGAQVARSGTTVITNGFSWPDTTVTLAPNQLFVRTIDFYCS